MDRRNFLLTAVSAASVGPATLAAPARRPNILIVLTDEHSADVTSASIGRRYIHTPNIDSLIASGTTYSRAYCANPICVPSRTAMFTGLYPTQTGVMSNTELGTTNLDLGRHSSMGRLFRDAGYDTAYFGKWHVTANPDQAARHGFMRMATTFNDDGAAAGAAAAFLREKRDTPFLMVASFLDPHSICEWARGEHPPLGGVGSPPPPDQCPPLRSNHGPQVDEPDIMAFMRESYQNAPMFPVRDFGPDKWRQYLWAYYRMVERADALVGIVLGALRESGLDDNTVVIFTSDHGDSQGAHGWNQKTVFYEESARVPFVISRKGAFSRNSDLLVNTGIDLVPTVCAAAGIPVPTSLPGSALIDPNVKPRDFVVVSNRMVQGAPVNGRTLTPEGRMVRARRFKYCAYSEGLRRESLVDLDSDPGEMVNLARHPGSAGELRAHRAMLRDWCRETGDRFDVPTDA